MLVKGNETYDEFVYMHAWEKSYLGNIQPFVNGFLSVQQSVTKYYWFLLCKEQCVMQTSPTSS